MKLNLGIIKGTSVSTKNGDYKCVDLWFGEGSMVVSYEFEKKNSEDRNIYIIDRSIIEKRLENNEIKIL